MQRLTTVWYGTIPVTIGYPFHKMDTASYHTIVLQSSYCTSTTVALVLELDRETTFSKTHPCPPLQDPSSERSVVDSLVDLGVSKLRCASTRHIRSYQKNIGWYMKCVVSLLTKNLLPMPVNGIKAMNFPIRR